MPAILPEPLTRTWRYRDAEGFLQEVTISTSQWREIEAFDRRQRREAAKWEERRVGFIEAGIAESQVEAAPLPREDMGNAWEGPRFKFPWLIGESRTWAGEPRFELEGETYCSFCLGAKLPGVAYCLGCDRSGRDDEIRAACEDERRTRQLRGRDGLKGGVE